MASRSPGGNVGSNVTSQKLDQDEEMKQQSFSLSSQHPPESVQQLMSLSASGDADPSFGAPGHQETTAVQNVQALTSSETLNQNFYTHIPVTHLAPGYTYSSGDGHHNQNYLYSQPTSTTRTTKLQSDVSMHTQFAIITSAPESSDTFDRLHLHGSENSLPVVSSVDETVFVPAPGTAVVVSATGMTLNQSESSMVSHQRYGISLTPSMSVNAQQASQVQLDPVAFAIAEMEKANSPEAQHPPESEESIKEKVSEAKSIMEEHTKTQTQDDEGSEDGVLDSFMDVDKNETLALNDLTIDESFLTVFSDVKATFSHTLLDTIPGSKSSFFKRLEAEHLVKVHHDDSGEYIVCGPFRQIVSAQKSLRRLMLDCSGQAGVSIDGQCDQLSQCDIVKVPELIQVKSDGPITRQRALSLERDREHKMVTRVQSKEIETVAESNGARQPTTTIVVHQYVKDKDADCTKEGNTVYVEKKPAEHTARGKISYRGKSRKSLRGRRQRFPVKTHLKEKKEHSESNVGKTCGTENVAQTINTLDTNSISKEIHVLTSKSNFDDMKNEESVKSEFTQWQSQSNTILQQSGNSIEKADERVILKFLVDATTSKEPNSMNKLTTNSEEATSSKKLATSSEDPNSSNKLPSADHTETSTPNTPTLVLGRKKAKKNYEQLTPFKFFCKQCSFKTKRESHFQKHLQIHEKVKTIHCCTLCNFTTLRLGHLRRHELEHSQEVFLCDYCKYSTDDNKLLQRHIKFRHEQRENPEPSLVLQCKSCDYKTVKPYHYQRHMRVHADGGRNKMFQCGVCEYKTSRKEHYTRHMNNVHTGRRPFLCDLCGKAFKRADALRQHKGTHMLTEDRDFAFHCHMCSKGFRSQAHLSEHLASHSDLRAFLCELCGASFKTRSVQRKHILTIHKNPRSHQCDQCEKRFNTSYALRRHQKLHYPTEDALPDEKVQVKEEIAIIQYPADQIPPHLTAHIIPAHLVQDSTAQDPQQSAQPIQIVSAEEYAQSQDTEQRPQYIQTSEATTALLYLTSNFGQY